MNDIRDKRLESLYFDLAARFLGREGTGKSLMTVTRIKLLKEDNLVEIYFTVLPEKYEEEALQFTKRMRSNFREFVMKNSRLGRVPFFDFVIDSGEKNRQAIDEIILGGAGK